MHYAVIGGDMRFVHLVRMLEKSGRGAAGFFQEKAGGAQMPDAALGAYDAVVSNWPVRCPLSQNTPDPALLLRRIAPGSTLLLCGPDFPPACGQGIKCVNLWEDEELLRENAYLTAEGAAAAVMAKLHGGLQNVRALVLGMGRIGNALVQILLNAGAQVGVVSGSPEKRNRAVRMGVQAFSPAEIKAAAAGRQVLFTTPPAEVLPHAVLDKIDRNMHIVDLASPPYGFDLAYARRIGLDAWREPGLPGRYRPAAAARAICHAILRWEASQNEPEPN